MTYINLHSANFPAGELRGQLVPVEPNHAPSFTIGNPILLRQYLSPVAQTVPGWASNISPGPPAEAGQALVFLVSTDNPGLFSAQPAISPDGTLTYQVYPGACGLANVTAVLMDNGGTANGGVDRSQPLTSQIRVVCVAPCPLTFKAVLSGSQEVPANSSTASGIGTVILSVGETHIIVNESWSGLTAPATASHIHGPAGPGINAAVLFPFAGVPAANSGSIPEQIFAITPAQVAQLKSGLLYMNVHDSTFPGGEIRGQLQPADEQNHAPSFTTGNLVFLTEDFGPVTVSGWAQNISAGPPAESGQLLNFLVSNDNPGLFSAQPALSPTGTLTFQTSTNACGMANVTAVLMDNGGTACVGGAPGVDRSQPVTFQIVVQCVNDCPRVPGHIAAYFTNVSSISIPLVGFDAEGNPLTYIVTQPPTHGSLVVNANTGASIYTPNPGYCGPDSFKYKVNDGTCDSNEGTVDILVICNRCPTAVIEVSTPCDANPILSPMVLISPNNSNACVVLDASTSSDPDGDSLTYVWLTDLDGNGTKEPFASGTVVTNCLPLGAHDIMVMVDDGQCSASVSVNIEVITACDAVEELILLVNNSTISRQNKRPFIASLKAACASLARGSFYSARGQLSAFQNKVRAQVSRDNPSIAAQWIAAAQQILDARACE